MRERRAKARKKLSIELQLDLLGEVDRIGAHWHWSRARTIEILLRDRLCPEQRGSPLVPVERAALVGTLEDSPALDAAAPGTVDDYEGGKPLPRPSVQAGEEPIPTDIELFV